MPNWFDRLFAGRAAMPSEQKMAGPQTMFTLSHLGTGTSAKKGFAALANEGFLRNPVVYRCVRLVAESAARVPLEVADGASVLTDHPLLDLLNRALLENAARPSGALVYNAGTGNLTEDQYQRLKGELEEGFMGAINAGRPMVLEGGLDWKAIALSPKDMDFLEAKNAAAREIALAFGVPPMLLGIPGDNTYANYAEASRALWRQAVIPLVTKVIASLNHWLSPAFAGARLVPDFDVIEALAADRKLDWERVGNASFLTDDEKRELLGFGKI